MSTVTRPRLFSELEGAVPFTRTSGPAFDVAPGVVGLRSVMVNVYFLGTRESWVLVDAGLPISAHAIRAKATELFGDAPPKAILLTHGHFDHTGVLKTLADEWDVPVYAHPLEMPYLNGTAPYAPPDPWVGGMFALTSPLLPRGPVDVSGHLRALPENGSVPFVDGWRWLHTPGHAPGHVSFYREQDRVLVAGDAFVTTRQEYVSTVIAQTQHVFGPPRYFTHDWQAAEASVRQLSTLDIEVAATGHGTPMRGQTLRDQLNDLAANFREREVPKDGRYADRPVISDEQGPARVPAARPIPPAVMALAAGVAVAGLIGVAAAAIVAHEAKTRADD